MNYGKKLFNVVLALFATIVTQSIVNAEAGPVLTAAINKLKEEGNPGGAGPVLTAVINKLKEEENPGGAGPVLTAVISKMKEVSSVQI
jgi:hypothetical protein